MKSALLIIDVQRSLFDHEPRPADADAVISRINNLSAKARAAGVPVIFIQHETKQGELVYGSPGWKLERQLQISEGDHAIRKTSPDSFLRTSLGDLLQDLQIEKLVVCGYATEFCIDSTVRRAAGLGYPIILAADTHTTHDKAHASAEQIRSHHNVTLPNLTSFGPAITAVNAADIQFN